MKIILGVLLLSLSSFATEKNVSTGILCSVQSAEGLVQKFTLNSSLDSPSVLSRANVRVGDEAINVELTLTRNLGELNGRVYGVANITVYYYADPIDFSRGRIAGPFKSVLASEWDSSGIKVAVTTPGLQNLEVTCGP